MHKDHRLLVAKDPVYLTKTLQGLSRMRCRLLHRLGPHLAVVALKGSLKELLRSLPKGISLAKNAEEAERLLGKTERGEKLALAALKQPESKPPPDRSWEEEGFWGCDAD